MKNRRYQSVQTKMVARVPESFTEAVSPQTSSFCTASSILCLAVMAMVLRPSGVSAQQFPSSAMNEPTIPSAAVFQVTVTDPKMLALMNVGVGADSTETFQYEAWDPVGQTLTSPLMYDPMTQIGVSGAHQYETLPANQAYFSGSGVAVGATPLLNYPHYVTSYSQYIAFPSPSATYPWNFQAIYPHLGGPDEVFTEIQELDLSPIGQCGVYSNTPPPPQIPPPTSLNSLTVKAGSANPLLQSGTVLQPSMGIVQSANYPQVSPGPADFPAHSFFAVNVEIVLPPIPNSVSSLAFPAAGAVLVSDPNAPLIVESDIPLGQSLPPTVVYTHVGDSSIQPWSTDLYFRDTSPYTDPNTGQPFYKAGDSFGTIVLAGHGTGLDPCSKDAASISNFVNAVMGLPGQLAPRATVGRIFNSSDFPSPNSIYASAPGTNFGGSSVDVIVFSNGVSPLYVRDIVLSNLVAPVSLPSIGNSAVYTNTNAVVMFDESTDGSFFVGAQATGTVVMQIINTNAPIGNATIYSTELLTLNATGSGGAGSFKLRLSPTKSTFGQHIVQPLASGDFKIGGYYDLAMQYGPNNGLFYVDGNRPTIRIEQESSFVCGASGAALFVTKTNSTITLTWPDITYRLQGRASLSSGSWQDIPGMSPVTMLSSNVEFFRLICP